MYKPRFVHLLYISDLVPIYESTMTLRLRRWSAPGTNGLRRSGLSCDSNICLRCSITWISLADMICYLTTKNYICNFFISLFTACVSTTEQPSYVMAYKFAGGLKASSPCIRLAAAVWLINNVKHIHVYVVPVVISTDWPRSSTVI